MKWDKTLVIQKSFTAAISDTFLPSPQWINACHRWRDFILSGKGKTHIKKKRKERKKQLLNMLIDFVKFKKWEHISDKSGDLRFSSTKILRTKKIFLFCFNPKE